MVPRKINRKRLKLCRSVAMMLQCVVSCWIKLSVLWLSVSDMKKLQKKMLL